MVAGKRFRPSPGISLVVILMLALLLGLGTWQMHRSQEKQELLDSFAQAPTMPAVGLTDIDADWVKYRYRRIVLRGRYDAQHQVLLQNQVRQGRHGYFVFTPFLIEDSEDVVLINRGWVPQADEMNSLPDIAVSGDIRSLAGLMNHPPAVGIRMGSLDDSAPGWPKVVPYLDVDWLALQTGTKIRPWVMLLGAQQQDGYVRQWQPSVRMTPEKHQGYAFQWYSLAVALVFLFVAGSMRPEADDGDREDT